MVEAESHLKLLPTSVLDIYKVFWHIAYAYGRSLKHLYTCYLAQILGLWVTCGVNMM
jgi:hypothetical protein